MPEQEQELFAEETKLEERGISLRLVAIIFLVVTIGAAGAWFMIKQQKDLTADVATPVLAADLKARIATVHFHVGEVSSSVDEKPRDPHYKLLQKAGVISWADNKKGGATVKITPDGQQKLAALPEFTKEKNEDGTDAYTIPVARRELVDVHKVTMRGANTATVEYSWKWVPNEIGTRFDANSKEVKTFNTWERQNLINNYGVDFYTETQKSTVRMMRTDKGWKIAPAE